MTYWTGSLAVLEAVNSDYMDWRNDAFPNDDVAVRWDDPRETIVPGVWAIRRPLNDDGEPVLTKPDMVAEVTVCEFPEMEEP